MLAILLLSIFIALVLVRKIGIGPALLIASLFLGFSSIGASLELLKSYLHPQSFEVLFLLILTYFLAQSMDHFGFLERVSNSFSSSFGALSLAMIPLIVGLIPMPAGALVSATMLLPMLKSGKLSAERLTVINYWFRHVWTTIWPLYPSVIIALAVLGKDYSYYASLVFPISLFSFLAGFLLLSGFERSFRPENLKEGIIALYPILCLIFLYLATKMLIFAVAVSIVLLLIDKKPDFANIRILIMKAVDLRLIVLVFAVMGYKNIIEASNLAQLISTELSYLPVPQIAFILAFIVGFSTGIELSYSSIVLPVFIGTAEESGTLLMLILGGFVGVILSPFHLCFALTIEFFKANMYKCYLILLKPVIVLILAISSILLLQWLKLIV
ncbi:MAG: DUF401 family protein [Archaeoglobaceae archaeon]|nr:DUF401 family protein [Archaeoglobaceae archaeon]MDW8118674.1 DUF401 family protein [Archaeoglobaceae archaeon]